MPEYLAPGVYVEEVDTGNKPIEGVSTSTAGLVGFTVMGPTDGPPQLMTSFAEYRRLYGGYVTFGGFDDHRFLPHAVEGFFINGGKRVYIKRVKGTGSKAATTTTKGGLVTRLAQDTSPAALNKAKLVSLRGVKVGTSLTFSQIKKGVTMTSGPHAVTVYNSATGDVTLGSNLTFPASVPPDGKFFESRYTTITTDLPRAASFDVSAANEGSWANADPLDAGLDVRVTHTSAGRGEIQGLEGASPSNKLRLRSAAGFYPNAWVEIDRGVDKTFVKVTAVDGQVITLAGPALAAADITPQPPATVAVARTAEFRLTASYGGNIEAFDGLTLLNVPGRFYQDVLKSSQLVKVGPPPAGDGNPLLYPSPDDGLRFRLFLGTDGTPPADADYKGVDNGPGLRTGLTSMIDIDEVSIVAIPGIASSFVQDALIAHCELLKDRFAILDPANKDQTLDEIKTQRQSFDTKYAAIYYPRLSIYDPPTDQEIGCPPSGHVAGIYARTDVERGVHKAPANEVVRGIVGLRQMINQGEQEILNPLPLNINVIRDFRSSGRGYRVWGARCITSDPDWKYIPVRRLFIFLEESIDQGTQWVVFEPNDEPLWARVRGSVSAFLRTVWRDGALQGATPEQAYFVRCDRTTMTQADIDNGRLIMEIGVAPVKPAEFVIFRIGQWTGGSSVEEE